MSSWHLLRTKSFRKVTVTAKQTLSQALLGVHTGTQPQATKTAQGAGISWLGTVLHTSNHSQLLGATCSSTPLPSHHGC